MVYVFYIYILIIFFITTFSMIKLLQLAYKKGEIKLRRLKFLIGFTVIGSLMVCVFTFIGLQQLVSNVF